VVTLFGSRLFASDAGHDLVLVWGDQVDYAALGSAKVIHLTSIVPASDRPADVLIPVSTMFERSGSYTNFEGKVNRFKQVFDKPAQVMHACDVFGRL
jgi:NADH dehydrogenase/NADH:ubiquinone oxidoreductase subunit G